MNSLLDKIESITLEFALRRDNYSIGSGLGGNPEALFHIIGRIHKFDEEVDDVTVNGPHIIWNPNWLRSSDVRTIRKRLEENLSQVNILNLIFESKIIKDPELFFEWYDSKFNKEVDAILGGKFDFTGINQVSQLVLISLCIRRIAKYIDAYVPEGKAGEHGFIIESGKALLKIAKTVSPSIMLFALRNNIGLSRVITSGLDEIESYSDMLAYIADSTH